MASAVYNTYISPYIDPLFNERPKLILSKEDEEAFSKYPATQRALTALVTLAVEGKFFTSTVVDCYLNVVRCENIDRFVYSNEGVTFMEKPRDLFDIAQTIHEEIRDQTHIAIPYVINNHHVVIYVVKGKYACYYDPFGNPPSAEMTAQLDKVRYLFEIGNKLIVNTTRHQNDYYQCAIWGSLCIKELTACKSPEDFFATHYSFEDIYDFRVKDMARRIFEHAQALVIVYDKDPYLAQ